MRDSRRLRGLLAIDAIGTALLGVVIYLRPGWLVAVTDGSRRLRSLATPAAARRAGLAVAILGAAKGALYAIAFVHLRGEDAPDSG